MTMWRRPTGREKAQPRSGSSPDKFSTGCWPRATHTYPRFHARRTFPSGAALLRLPARICGFSADAAYHARLEALKQAGFALWDVLQQCAREGSLDSAISKRTEVPNDITGLLDANQTIDRICFNGAKAEESFRRHLLKSLPEERDFRLIRLPSTSPAHAGMRFEEKLDIWRESLVR